MMDCRKQQVMPPFLRGLHLSPLRGLLLRGLRVAVLRRLLHLRTTTPHDQTVPYSLDSGKVMSLDTHRQDLVPRKWVAAPPAGLARSGTAASGE